MNRKKKFILGVLATLFIAGLAFGIAVYQVFLSANTNSDEEPYVLYVYSKATAYEAVYQQLEKDNVLKSPGTFDLVAKALKYDQYIKAGRYEISSGMNNLELVRKLRSGAQDAIELKLLSKRTISGIQEQIASQLAFSEMDLQMAMNDADLLADLQTDPTAIKSIFIPNTYFIYWTTSPEDLLKRLKNEYEDFWNENRRAKAENLGLTPYEVTVLASIVQAETYMNEEKPTIAGVYLNRLRKNMLLQADPTVIYAVGDFSIKRVLNKHTEVDNPFNTYKYAGLPPGPINNPDPVSIDAVLNYQQHDYLYFCAKSDFSGYHNFAKTLSQHNQYAREYQRALSALQKKQRSNS